MNSEWKQAKYEAGSGVRILQIGEKEDEDAIMLTTYDRTREDNPRPLFKLHDGKVIAGSDCWWIPKAELTPEAEEVLHQNKAV